MLMQGITDILIGTSRYPRPAHYNNIDIGELIAVQSEAFPDQTLYPVTVYCSTGAFFRYRQPKAGTTTAILSPKNRKTGIARFFGLLKNLRIICGGEQPQTSRKPRLSCWQ